MKFSKDFFISLFIMVAMLLSFEASAVSIFDSLTTAVSFTDLIAALGTVFAGIIGLAIFILGAKKIAGTLGFRAN